MKEMCLRRCCPSKLEVTYHNTSVWQTDVTGIKVDINKYKYKKTLRIDRGPVQEQMAEFGLKSNSALNLDAPSPSAFLLSSFSLSSCLLFSDSLTCTEYYPILIYIQLNLIGSSSQTIPTCYTLLPDWSYRKKEATPPVRLSRLLVVP